MKTNDCEATLRKGNLPKAEAVKTAVEDKTSREKSVKQQTESNRYSPDASSKLLSEDGV